jgi:hypothetical protein
MKSSYENRCCLRFWTFSSSSITTSPTNTPRCVLGWRSGPAITCTTPPPIPLGSTRWKHWFGLITQRAIRRGSFTSVQDRVRKIDAFVQHYNRSSRPFAWTASADSILQKIARLCSRIYGTLGVATRIAQDKSPATHSPSSRNINAVRRADVDARYFCVNLNGA